MYYLLSVFAKHLHGKAYICSILMEFGGQMQRIAP